MKWTTTIAAVSLLSAPALAQDNPWDMAKKAAGNATTSAVEDKVNKQLLTEAQQNQCSFKTDSDQLAPGCDQKLKKLVNALIDAKKKLDTAGVKNFKFEVSGHTDTSGKAEHNKELSQKRAATIVKELVARGTPNNEITAVGMGSEHPLVTPDNTPAKKAKNRRYEIRVRL
jgi:outer membrane protein OmpA-like peptidoglycan-associated protein